jgi:hypothetical protein
MPSLHVEVRDDEIIVIESGSKSGLSTARPRTNLNSSRRHATRNYDFLAQAAGGKRQGARIGLDRMKGAGQADALFFDAGPAPTRKIVTSLAFGPPNHLLTAPANNAYRLTVVVRIGARTCVLLGRSFGNPQAIIVPHAHRTTPSSE